MTSRTATLIGLTAILMWSLLAALTVATSRTHANAAAIAAGGRDLRRAIDLPSIGWQRLAGAALAPRKPDC